jgi:hypothetical protein
MALEKTEGSVPASEYPFRYIGDLGYPALGDPTTRETFSLNKDWRFLDANWAYSSNKEKLSNGLEWIELTGVSVKSKSDMILRGKLCMFSSERQLTARSWLDDRTGNSEKYIAIPRGHPLFVPFLGNIQLLKSFVGRSCWLSLSPRWSDENMNSDHPLIRFYLVTLNR